jgi:hypothetical protein
MDQRYQAPSAALDAEVPEAVIDELNVSDKWKQRFHSIRKAGPLVGGSYQNIKALSVQEQRAIGFNILAFLFGVLYYLVKGMPRKGLMLVGFGWLFSAAVTILESILGFAAPNALYWIPIGAVAAVLANRDYYQKMVMGRHMWAALKMFQSWAASVAFALLSFVVLVFVIASTMPAV